MKIETNYIKLNTNIEPDLIAVKIDVFRYREKLTRTLTALANEEGEMLDFVQSKYFSQGRSFTYFILFVLINVGNEKTDTRRRDTRPVMRFVHSG